MDADTPHERFIVGQGESGRVYITHTRVPRFVAELFEYDDTRYPGVSMLIEESGEVLANFVWIDPPAGVNLVLLRQHIKAFIAESDFRADAELDAHDRRRKDEENT